MSIDVNVTNDLVIVTESSEDISVNVSNAQGPAGQGVPVGGTAGQVLKKLSNTNYDTFWTLDGVGVPYTGATGDVNLGAFNLTATSIIKSGGTSSQFLKANGSVDSTTYTPSTRNITINGTTQDLSADRTFSVGTVTSLTLATGTTGTDVNVSNGTITTSGTITLNLPDASATARGLITTGTQTIAGAKTFSSSPTVPSLYLSNMTAGSGALYYNTPENRLTLANYNVGGILMFEVNGGTYAMTLNADLTARFNGYTTNGFVKFGSSNGTLVVDTTTYQPLLTNPVTGTGAAGQVAYWNGTNSQTGSNNLFWDAANNRLGIGTNSPQTTLHIQGGLGSFRVLSSGAEVYLTRDGNNDFLANGGTSAELSVGANNALKFWTGTTLTERARITAVGNLLVGSTLDGGQRLQVMGDAFIKGSGATFSTVSLQVQNSSGTNLFRVYNSGQVRLGNTGSSPLVFPQADLGTVEDLAGRNLSFYSYTGSQSASSGRYFFGGENMVQTTGANFNIYSRSQFFPTSGTATLVDIYINPQISQSGGANGITRGLYVNPTLTAAADWRSIEWSNNSGWGLYGAGTANNYLAGSLGIGTTSPSVPLHVIGNILVTGNSPVFSGGALEIQGSANAIKTFYINRYGVASGSQHRLRAENGYFEIASVNSEPIVLTGGNLLVGTTVDSGFKIDINGTARVTGAATFSSNVTMVGLNNNSTSTFSSLATFNGNISLGGNATLFSNGAATFSSSVTATSFIKSGGTSSQYLMADGSVTTGGGGGVDELQVALLSQVYG
jgi:hypothetical protein